MRRVAHGSRVSHLYLDALERTITAVTTDPNPGQVVADMVHGFVYMTMMGAVATTRVDDPCADLDTEWSSAIEFVRRIDVPLRQP